MWNKEIQTSFYSTWTIWTGSSSPVPHCGTGRWNCTAHVVDKARLDDQNAPCNPRTSGVDPKQKMAPICRQQWKWSWSKDLSKEQWWYRDLSHAAPWRAVYIFVCFHCLERLLTRGGPQLAGLLEEKHFQKWLERREGGGIWFNKWYIGV